MNTPESEQGSAVRFPDDFRRSNENAKQARKLAADNLDIPDQMIVNRIFKQSDALQDGQPLHTVVIDALAADEDMALEKSFEAGIAIGDHIASKYSNTRGRLLAYLNACTSIGHIKDGWIGTASPSQQMNLMLHFIRLRMSDSIEPTQENIELVEELLGFVELLKPGGLDLRWFAPKVATFRSLLTMRNAIRKRFGNTSETHGTPEESILEGRQQCRELMTQTIQQRRYGLKPAYIPASIGGSWVYNDTAHMRDDKFKDLSLVPMVAFIYHSTKTKFDKIPAAKTEQLGNGPSTTTIVSFGTKQDVQADFALHLGVDGELYLDEFGWRRLRDEIGDTQTNLDLTAELLANFHDLTVPTEHVIKHKLRNVPQLKKDGDKELQPVLDLVVPRLKSYEKRPKSEPTPVEEPKRTVREHGVVWHIRVLPEGWHPSSEAVANARRMGITLGPNETFVREHKRGLGNSVSGHRIMRRLIDKGLEG